ncbi:MAG: P-loop NTPase [Acidimicrobiales bacterium]|nr:P-loop NTPase [Acidimicrobiales bacterium]
MSLADALGILVTSGKGGVGKSLFSIGLAAELARRGPVGLLDLDTRSPNLHYLLGLSGDVEIDAGGRPYTKPAALGGRSVPVMSSGFLAEDGVPITMPGEEIRSAIAGEIVSAHWPADLRWLVLDVDPAPGDSIAAARRWLPRLAAFVVTASDVSSLQDCHRMVNALREEGVATLGMVGNMIGALCPNCGEAIAYGAEEPVRGLAARTGVPYLGHLPWHPVFRERPVWAVQNHGSELFGEMADRVEEWEGKWRAR